MKKQLVLPIVFGVIILGLGFTNFARASLLPNSKENTSMITSSDLGVTHVGTLPTSPFYFLKQWGHSITRLFTFGAVNKAKLELQFTNQTAAELLEVPKAYDACAANALGGGKSCKPGDKVGSVKNALQNFTKAQERLNARLAKLTETSENPNVAKLLDDVDAKTAKHAVLLEQLVIRDGDIAELVGDITKAKDNTQQTFTTAGEKAADVKQKATDQIAKATETIKQAETVFGQPVTFTASIVDDRGAGFIKSIAGTAPGAGTPTGSVNFTLTNNTPGVTVTSVGVPIPFLDIIIRETCARGNPCTSATGSTTGKAYTASTGSDGSYKFTGLEPGAYDLSIAGQVVQTITVGTDGTISGTVIYSDNHGEFRSSTTAVINGGDLLINVTTTACLAVGNIIRIDNELMIITALTPTSLTVQRGANGSTAGAHLAGAFITNISGMYGCLFPKFLTAIPSIANAKGHLANAKTAFADGKYGEAYGLARSAEAMVVGIGTILNDDSAPSSKAIGVPGDYNGDGTPDKIAPTGESTGSPKTPESPANKATPDKAETPAPSSDEPETSAPNLAPSAGNPIIP